MDSSLFNPQDWERIRQKLVEISLAPEDLNESDRKEKLIEDVQTPFVGLQKIQVDNPEYSLSSKPGFEWYWTSIGFQRLIEHKSKTNSSGLSLSAENVLFALREIGAKEIYAPIEGNRLSTILNTITTRVTCYHNSNMRSSGLP
jgi:hypothetical protein